MRIFSPVDHTLIGYLQSCELLRLRSDPEILRETELRRISIGQDDLGERKGVHCADEDTVVPLHAERVQTVFELARTFVVVGDAGDAAGLGNVLGQDARHLDRECLGLAAARSCHHHAVAGRVVRGPLSGVAAELLGGA